MTSGRVHATPLVLRQINSTLHFCLHCACHIVLMNGIALTGREGERDVDAALAQLLGVIRCLPQLIHNHKCAGRRRSALPAFPVSAI